MHDSLQNPYIIVVLADLNFLHSSNWHRHDKTTYETNSETNPYLNRLVLLH